MQDEVTSSFEKVEEFISMGIATANQNYLQEEVKLKPGNVWYHSVQNLLSSSLLSKNIKIKIYRTIIFPVVVLYGCEICSFKLR
jgi:hypothetical protein